MARAELVLPTGARVTVEGTPEEIDRLLRLYAGEPVLEVANSMLRRDGSIQENTPHRVSKGPKFLVQELRREGFFDAKRSLKSVVEKLAERGHIYSDPSVAKALQRLTSERELGRLKENGIWVYVGR